MLIIIKHPTKFEGTHYAAGEQNIADDLALRMVVAGVAVKSIPDSRIISLDGVFNSNGKFLGYIDPHTGLLLPQGSLADGVPNVTLTNAIGTTETLFTFTTIRGGLLKPDSQLEIRPTLTKAGAVTGDFRMRFGPASGTFTTATAFGGQGGFTSQAFINHLSEIWNNGTLNSQLASAVSVGAGIGSTGNAIVSGSVDTALDWNIYFSWAYTSAPTGGDSVTLRKFRVELRT